MFPKFNFWSHASSLRNTCFFVSFSQQWVFLPSDCWSLSRPCTQGRSQLEHLLVSFWDDRAHKPLNGLCYTDYSRGCIFGVHYGLTNDDVSCGLPGGTCVCDNFLYHNLALVNVSTPRGFSGYRKDILYTVKKSIEFFWWQTASRQLIWEKNISIQNTMKNPPFRQHHYGIRLLTDKTK